MSNIHSTAIIEDGAELHPSVQVGPYSIIEAGAVIGEGCIIESNVRIYSATRMGQRNRVCHGVTLGSEPQDLSYTPEKSKPLTIGDDNHFKEGVNISRGVKEEHGTIIGNNNYLMAYAHVGHDCIVGDHNIFANTATLAGHVEMEHHIFLSGHTATHQFCRIGAYAMVAGVSGVPQDVPPYVVADGHRTEIVGLNLVGLKRNGFSPQQRTAIKKAYKTIFKSGLKPTEALEKLKAEDPPEEVQHIIRFFEASKRGMISHR
ncbi:acyl-ACP--UDP-N-acetylglucosamine O-acyltransferase [Pseudomonadota bacterium]